MSQAQLQFAVNINDQNYLVISTGICLFKYTRLPFGLASAPAIFQRFISQLLGKIEGVASYLYDIIIASPTKEIQFERLKLVLNILNEANVQLNIDKCMVDVEELNFLGHVFSSKGVAPFGAFCNVTGQCALCTLHPVCELKALILKETS